MLASAVTTPTTVDNSALERRLRRAAHRQGLRVCKSRGRVNWLSATYMLIDADTNAVVASGSTNGYGLSLDDVAQELILRKSMID